MTGVMERLSAAFNAHDPAGVAACFRPDGELEVLSTGLVWAGQEPIGQVVDYLMATFQDLRWRPRNRWLDAGGATEEGIWSGTCVPQAADASVLPSAVPVELPARILVEHDGTAIRRLRLSTDLTGLRLALGLPVSAMAAAASASQYRTRTSQPSQLKVHVRPVDAPPVPPPAAPADRPKPPKPPRQRRGRGPSLPRWLTAILAAVATVAVGGGVVYLAARGAPPPAAKPPQGLRTTTSTKPAPSATSPSASPTQSQSQSPSSTPSEPAVTKRGRNLDISTDVLFETNSAVLSSRAQAALDEVVQQLRENNVVGTVTVFGYTDNVGSEKDNLALAINRATAVVQALQSRSDVEGLTFKAVGKGETNFVASNRTEDGRAKNRRVTIKLPKL